MVNPYDQLAMINVSAKKSKVALVACESYDNPVVLSALREAIDLLGGIGRFGHPGEKVLLKPNVLLGSSPDKCVCTHPAVFRAAATLFLEAGVSLTCGDSPGFGGTGLNMRLAGLKEVADELGIALADFASGEAVNHSDALLCHRFVIARGVLEADGLVSLSKLKTHALTRFTGAVKNQFGCIPGFEKKYHHARMPATADFGRMLVDLNTLLKPRLYVMDGVMAMEGNGPRGGSPRKLGLLLASVDPVALDAIACRIIGLDPEFVPTSAAGEEAGLGTYHGENIEVLGADIDDFFCPDFDVVREPAETSKRSRIRSLIKNRASARPVIDASLCTRCGSCIELCPVSPKAVDWRNGDDSRPPVHNYNRCIRCFCCQEICPESAIKVERPLLGKIFR